MGAPVSTLIQRIVPGAAQSQPAASSTVVVNLPLLTWAKLALYHTIAGVAATRAQLVAQVTQIIITVSGRELWRGSAAQLIAIQQYYSEIDTQTNYAGYLNLEFLRSWLADATRGMDAAIGLADQNAMQIELTYAGGATINGIAVYGVRMQLPQATGTAVRIVRGSASVSALGVFVYPDLPLPRSGDVLLAVHIFPPVVANFTNFAYIADEVRIIDAPPSFLNRNAAEAHPPRTPQDANGMVSLDFTALNALAGQGVSLGDVGSHQLELTFVTAAPGTVPILCEIASMIGAGNG
jgi:hypothetical protein